MQRETYQVEKTEEFRTRKVFSLFPVVILNVFSGDGDFVWTGKWFKFVEVYEQKMRVRYLEFDSGLTFQDYWTQWKTEWKFIKLINNK